ncbi:endonuclease NucS domain-containing protein [Aeromonas veronii bv. sobria]|uniref:endonuclease NucS domain-containing protein n=1 Tax=Aeromonas veronii TaxID=654 RepID=UPI0035BF0848
MSANRCYYRIFAGAKSVYAELCQQQGFIGGDWGIEQDLSTQLPDDWREFNKAFVPQFLTANPDKSRIAAGLACGMLHTICKGIVTNDRVLCPDGNGQYYVGEVISDYFYQPDGPLPHRRKVNWFPQRLRKDELSLGLKNSAGSIATVCNLSKYAQELDALLAGNQLPTLIHTDVTVEDPGIFALEKHLEEFLIANWAATELGKAFDIYSEDGELVGQQYPSDTGPIDILAVSKDKQRLLVVELKRGRASDAVVGQIQRYMGYVKDELCETNQTVHGVIIALEDDLKLRRALSVTQNIQFYRYQVNFKLVKA